VFSASITARIAVARYQVERAMEKAITPAEPLAITRRAVSSIAW